MLIIKRFGYLIILGLWSPWKVQGSDLGTIVLRFLYNPRVIVQGE